MLSTSWSGELKKKQKKKTKKTFEKVILLQLGLAL